MTDGSRSDHSQMLEKALKEYERGYDRERTNISLAFEDLEFRVGEQWPADLKKARDDASRPALTINQVPKFVRQVTGDIRLMRPGIKCVPVDDTGDEKTAEVLAGMFRYIENRSDAKHAYYSGADSQVAAGIGHWRVLTEYADDSTFNQEIRIGRVDDGVSVIWDPDAKLPNKEDAKYCFVPVDITRESYKARFPGFPVEDFERAATGRVELFNDWWGDSSVRIAEYWERRPAKRKIAVFPNGSIDDVTDEVDASYLAEIEAQGAKIQERDSYCIYRSLISLAHVLEQPVKWPGRYIPIVPVVGEEVVIGQRVIRHGIVRYLKDPQRMYNYFRSAETETIALQPKAPWLGTEKNFEGQESQWAQANQENQPFLTYTPDSKNGNLPPQRVQASANTVGIVEGLKISVEEMKGVVGIYDAGLGARSNETSGKAIQARKQESDIGTFVYVDNFARAVRYTGKIVLDLIPHVYDTRRIVRIVGEDGKMRRVAINGEEENDIGGMLVKQKINDVTAGVYDVVLDSGPSYGTKREEAREGMNTFLNAAPNVAPVVLDLIAEAQDWPSADKFAKRLRTLLPPQIQAMEAEESGEQAPPPPQPQESPEAIVAQIEAETAMSEKQIDLRIAEIGLEQKQVELRIKEIEAQTKREQLAASAAQTIAG